VEHIAGAVGIDHTRGRDWKGRHRTNRPRLVVPDQAFFTHGHAADPAAAALQIVEHVCGGHIHLFAQALGDDCDVDELEQLVCIGSQAAAIERGQNSGLAAHFGIVDRGIGLMAVDMQRPAIAEVEMRKRMDVLVVTATHDRALAVLRHDE